MRSSSRLVPALLVLAGVAAPRAAAAAPLFTERTARLGSPQPCFDPQSPDAEGCYSNYVVMADLDGDHHLDLVLANGGGYYTPDTTAPLTVYLNDGKGLFHDVNASLFGGFKGRVRQVAVGDIDGDGDLDLFVPDGYGLSPDALFVNDGKRPPTFTDESAERLPVSSRAGAVRFGDVDGDGDLDLVVTDWGNAPPDSPGTARVYLNDGTGHFKEKLGAVPQTTQAIGTGPIDADLFDADGDLDLDLVLASRVGSSLLFLNDGKGHFAVDPTFPHQPGPYVYGPDECDIDGDGDLDVWLDNGGAGHTEQLLVNDGKGHFTDETAKRVHGNPSADDNAVKCADVNGDGALDAVIASLSDNERVLLNDGGGRFALTPGAFPVEMDSTLGLDLGDLDGDGVLDVVTAQGESGPFLDRLYFGIAPQPADVRPPVFRAVERLPDGTAPGPAVVRFAVSDAVTTDVGPRLRGATVEVGATTVIATFSGGDLFRAAIDVPAGGPVRYRACATDWAGNHACSAEITFLPAGATTTTGAGTSTTGAGGAGGAARTTGAAAGAGGGSTGGGSTGGGSGCAMGPSPGRALPALLGLLAAGALSRRRRKPADG